MLRPVMRSIREPGPLRLVHHLLDSKPLSSPTPVTRRRVSADGNDLLGRGLLQDAHRSGFGGLASGVGDLSSSFEDGRLAGVPLLIAGTKI